MPIKEQDLHHFLLGYGLTEEVTRAFSSKFHPALMQAWKEANTPLKLPKIAPELYEHRPMSLQTNKRETALEFYTRVWKPFADAGLLYQYILDDLDVKLIPAIRSYCQKRKLDAKAILPPRKMRETELKAQGIHYSVETIAKANAAMNKRKSRASDKVARGQALEIAFE